MTAILIVVGIVAVAVATYFVLRTKDEQEKPVVTNQGNGAEQEPPQKPEEKPEKPKEDETPIYSKAMFITKAFNETAERFSKIIPIPVCSMAAHYLECLTYECYYQYYEEHSNVGLPAYYKRENFPVAYDYWNGDGERNEDSFTKMLWWVFAMVLAEFRPDKRNELFRNAYFVDDFERIFGYGFYEDGNVCRIVASAIYASARGKLKQFDRNKMRYELGGGLLDMTLQEMYDTPSEEFQDSLFWIDFRQFIPAKPAPYLKGYDKVRRETYTEEELDEFGNLMMDRKIHEYIVENYNLDNEKNRQRTVQAIADKEANANHLFGDFKTTKHYHFYPVFGKETIGVYISPCGDIANLAELCKYICSWSREPLMSKDVTPKEYGRLRPGGSWTEECKPNSAFGSPRNVLVDFEIEDGDGSPTGYYDGDGKWTHPEIISSEEEFVKYYQKMLYANSYPSGHSAAITGVALVLMEMMPDKSDLILRFMNSFAISRTICRYHWTSDTKNGRIVGAATSAILRAAKDFDERLELAKKELK